MLTIYKSYNIHRVKIYNYSRALIAERKRNVVLKISSLPQNYWTGLFFAARDELVRTNASDRVVFRNNRSALLDIEILCDQMLYTIEIYLTWIGAIKRNSLNSFSKPSRVLTTSVCFKFDRCPNFPQNEFKQSFATERILYSLIVSSVHQDGQPLACCFNRRKVFTYAANRPPSLLAWS